MLRDEKTGILIADFTLGNLAGLLANDEAQPAVRCTVVEPGQVVPALLDDSLPCWAERYDFAVVWSRAEVAVPSFGRALDFEEVSIETILQEVDTFAAAIESARGRARVILVPSWVMAPSRRGYGVLDMRPGRGLAHILMQMNLRLADRLRACSDVLVLDASRWVAAAGSEAMSPKLWYLGKIPFGNPVFKAAVRDVKAAIRAVHGKARKLVVVDLDDTLWGGIVGEVGWQNVKLGGHDAEGEGFADFQRALKALSRRGVVLGIVSKNEESVALEAIRNHPEMVLREADFAGHRINWQDKAQNIADLTRSLNLGLDAVVFIDDSPFERARVREALPEVLVPEWPKHTMLYAETLRSMDCFDVAAVTAEDAARTEMYRAERAREEARTLVSTPGEWLRSLGLTVKMEQLTTANLPRAAQLLNKTNQMNLATRRLTEAELWEWASEPGHRVWTTRVTDRFGDAGLVGLVGLSVSGERAEIVDFLMSCRVMSRKVEDAMLCVALEHAAGAGAETVAARFLPTPRNEPFRGFLARAGTHHDTATDVFTWSAREQRPRPEEIAVEVVDS